MPDQPSATDQLVLLQQKVDEFSLQRDWEKFHTPKNLTMALTIEAAELMEIFQWQEGADGFAGL
jgi:dCTP diphosphatase